MGLRCASHAAAAQTPDRHDTVRLNEKRGSRRLFFYFSPALLRSCQLPCRKKPPYPLGCFGVEGKGTG